MKAATYYRGLLRLYPIDFRQQFSEEMTFVFEQKAQDCFQRGVVSSLPFVFREFVGALKGAQTMWIEKLMFSKMVSSKPRDVQPVAAASSEGKPERAELSKLREETVKKMVHAIANHDFAEARRCSDQDRHFTKLLRELGPEQELSGEA